MAATLTPSQLFDLATTRHRDADLIGAEKLYQRVVEQDPTHADGWFLLSVIAMGASRLENAVELLGKAIALAPENPVYHSNLGEAYRRLGRAEDAVSSLLHAVTLKPDLPEPTFNLGLALQAKGELDGALSCFERAADLKPDMFAIQFSLAGALVSRGELARAVGHYQCALALKPKSLDANIDLGNVLHLLGRLDGAVAAYRRALAIDPKAALAHNNLGNVWLDNQQVDEAITCFRQALAIQPTFAAAHTNLGNAFKDYARLDESVASYREAMAANPNDDAGHGNLVYTLSFHPDHDARSILKEATAWRVRHADPFLPKIASHANDRNAERRLRIGYVSQDFRNHCQSFFTLPLFRHHDHDAFEIFCYSSVKKPDTFTERLRGHADQWRNVLGRDDASLANMVREDKIDVLVDLTMHMAGGRLKAFAEKPAPVQICWLAYPGTTGLSTMDYRITDPYLDPLELEADNPYAERPLRLPDTFWCYDPQGGPDVNALPALRDGRITFGCLNNFCKINDAVLELWARVLRAVDGSRLLLLAPVGARKHTQETLGRAGVDPERVEFLDRHLREEYLAQYHRIDICLDSVPYNGHTTSLDAFWMGVPVVTLVGRTVVGRAGLCQAKNLGLPELVATTPDDFVARVVDLTRDLNRLGELRAGLRDRMTRSPLMDAPRFARNIEAAYRTAWRSWCQAEGR